jgi:CRP-like cAMP-binding protein
MMWSDPEEEKKDLAAGHTTPKEIAGRLREKLGAMRHFATLSSVEMEELAFDCEFWSYDPGDVVLAQGKPGHFLLFIVSGSAAVYKRETRRRSSISSNTYTADTSPPLMSSSASRKSSFGARAASCASAAQKAGDGVRKVASQEDLSASVGLQRRIDRSLSLDAVPGPKPYPQIMNL